MSLFEVLVGVAFILVIVIPLVVRHFALSGEVKATVEAKEERQRESLHLVHTLRANELNAATKTYLERSGFDEDEIVAIARDSNRELSQEIRGIGPMRAADIHAAIYSGYATEGEEDT